MKVFKSSLVSILLTIICFGVFFSNLNAQNKYIPNHNDSSALVNVLVEKYYNSVESDYSDTSINTLPKGSTTYRIYIEMKPEYKLMSVWGSKNHALYLETTTNFFNNTQCIAETGFNIDMKKINLGTIAFDSWITLGAAGRGFTGIPLAEDTDNTGLLNFRPAFANADGFTKAVLPDFKIFGDVDLHFFTSSETNKKFSVVNGAWWAPYGVKGPTKKNRVLVAQLTTNGKLSFSINVQLLNPSGEGIQFVPDNPTNNEIKFASLKYN